MYILLRFILGETVHVVVHGNPLAKGFVDSKLQGVVEGRQPSQKDSSPVPGIHLKVKDHLQIVEDGVAGMFDVGVLESLPVLDYDHLVFVADRAAVRPMDRKETLAFCTAGLNTPEWSAAYAAKLQEVAYAVSLEAKSHRDWMRAAKLFGKASMFQHSGVEIPGFREKREEIEKTFVSWIGEKYAGLHGVSDLQRPVLLSKVNDFIRKGNDKIALILMDGMSFEDFFMIRRESVSAPFNCDVEASFSFFPTVTSVARQSMFSGKLPKELDDPFSVGNEEKAWQEY